MEKWTSDMSVFRSFTTGLTQGWPGAFLSPLPSPWVWFMQGRGRRAQGCVWWWLFLSLEKRKETATDASARREVLAHPRLQRFQEASVGRRLPRVPQQLPLPWAPQQLLTVPRGTWTNPICCDKTQMSPSTPRAAFPKGSVAVQVLQKGEILKRAGFALKIKASCPGCGWVCPLATGRATVAKGGWPAPVCEERDSRPQFGRWISYIEATGRRLMCLTCHISLVIQKQLLNFLFFRKHCSFCI